MRADVEKNEEDVNSDLRRCPSLPSTSHSIFRPLLASARPSWTLSGLDEPPIHDVPSSFPSPTPSQPRRHRYLLASSPRAHLVQLARCDLTTSFVTQSAQRSSTALLATTASDQNAARRASWLSNISSRGRGKWRRPVWEGRTDWGRSFQAAHPAAQSDLPEVRRVGKV